MPEWMHNRAEHILAKNPSMPKGEAFAIATQQMHSLGKGPKDYGTAEGRRTAKAKFDTPKNDVKASNPGHLKSEKMEKKTAAEEEKPGGSPNLRQYLKATGAGLGAAVAGQGLGLAAMSQATKSRPGDAQLMEHLKQTASVPIERSEGPVIGGAHFSPGAGHWSGMALGGPEGPHVKVPADWNNPAFLAHELGHADIHKNRIGHVVQNPITGIAGTHGAAVAGQLGGFASGFSDDPRVRRAGLLAPLVMSAPTLAYEAGASIQGLRRLRQGGANAGQLLQAGKALLPAWGSYAARTGAQTAGAAGMQAIGGAIHAHNKRVAGAVQQKEAGMRVDFDLHGNPVRAQTHDEWLAGIFKRDGSFMVPGMLDHVSAMGKHGMAGFVDELEAMKEAGMLGDFAESAKKVLTTPIPGTPELFPHAAVEAAERFGKVAPAAAATTTKAPVDWRAARQAAFRKQAGPGLRLIGSRALGGASIGTALGGMVGSSRKPKPDSDNFGDRHPMLQGMTSGALRGGVIGGALGLNPTAFKEMGHAAGKLVNKAKAMGTVAKQDIAEQTSKSDPEVEQVMKRVHDITSGRAKPGT